jgi:hypothetical protein
MEYMPLPQFSVVRGVHLVYQVMEAGSTAPGIPCCGGVAVLKFLHDRPIFERAIFCRRDSLLLPPSVKLVSQHSHVGLRDGFVSGWLHSLGCTKNKAVAVRCSLLSSFALHSFHLLINLAHLHPRPFVRLLHVAGNLALFAQRTGVVRLRPHHGKGALDSKLSGSSSPGPLLL